MEDKFTLDQSETIIEHPETEQPKPDNTPIEAPQTQTKNAPSFTTTSTQTPNTDSFFSLISKPREALVEPPKPKQEEAPQEDTPQEQIDEAPKQSMTPEALGVSAEFIVETEDLLIPELMARLSPDDDNPEDYELKPKNKEYLLQSWKRYLDHLQVEMTPGQQIVAAHFVGFGAPMLLNGMHRLFKYMDDKKKEKEQPKDNTEVEQLKQMIADLQNQVSNKPPQAQAEHKPETEVIVSEQPAQQVQQPQPQNNMAQPKEDISQEVEVAQAMKICANDKCKKPFKAGEGYTKKKTSKFYDLTCSKPCSNRVVGITGGRKKTE